jgi:hypothetical protein
MDGTRGRRTRDRARQAWYAAHRQRRFARWLGFGQEGAIAGAGRPQPPARAAGVALALLYP